MAKNNLVKGPCEEMLKGVNVSTKPSGSPKVNGEAIGPKRTSSPNGVDEVNINILGQWGTEFFGAQNIQRVKPI